MVTDKCPAIYLAAATIGRARQAIRFHIPHTLSAFFHCIVSIPLLREKGRLNVGFALILDASPSLYYWQIYIQQSLADVRERSKKNRISRQIEGSIDRSVP